MTSEPVGPGATRGTSEGDATRKWWVVVAMSGVMIILTLDFFGLTVALPAIGQDLNASTSTLLWTVNAYLLAFVAPMIAIGRLADIVGRRKIALGGVVLFVIGSIGCGAAPTDIFLICARVVQGIGGGAIFTVSVSIVNNAFRPDERAKALGIWSGVGLAGSAIGPFVAGILTQYASWRWFFFLNVPIGLATIALTLRYVEESRDESFTGGIDWSGFALLTTGFVSLIFGMQQAAESGWSSPVVFGPIVVGVVLLGAFAWSELRMRSRPPLVEFSLFRDARFAGANVVAFIGNWMFGSILFFLTLYLQNVLDLDALDTGLVFLVFSVPLVAMSPIGGRMVERFGAQQLMAVGMALVGVGVGCFVLIDTDTGVGLVIVGLVLAGFGQGFAYNLSNTAGMEAMPDEKAGVASGVLQTSRLMGIVVGLALSGALFKSFENRQLFSDFHATTGRALTASNRSEIRGLLSGSDEARHRLTQLGHHSQGVIDRIVDQAFVHGLRAVMVLSVVLCFLSVWPALWGRTVRAGREGRHPSFGHPHWALTWRRSQRVLTLIGSALLAGTTGLASAPAAGAAVATAVKYPTLSIRAEDFSFRMPAKVAAGWTTVNLVNDGGEPHQAQLAKLDPGVTAQQVVDAGKTGGVQAIVALLTPMGGPNAAAPRGGTASVTVNLAPGNYVALCFIPSADGTRHYAEGMIQTLTVAPAKGKAAKARAKALRAPKAKATIALNDFSFGFPAAGLPANGVVAVKNAGAQDHEMALYQLAPGKTLDDAKAFLLTPPGAPPPAGPPPITEAGGMVGLAPGATGYLDLGLEPGTYVAVCFFPDPTKGGLPHAIEGMLGTVTVA